MATLSSAHSEGTMLNFARSIDILRIIVTARVDWMGIANSVEDELAGLAGVHYHLAGQGRGARERCRRRAHGRSGGRPRPAPGRPRRTAAALHPVMPAPAPVPGMSDQWRRRTGAPPHPPRVLPHCHLPQAWANVFMLLDEIVVCLSLVGATALISRT